MSLLSLCTLFTVCAYFINVHTSNNVHRRKGKDYFTNSVVQIPFYKDPSITGYTVYIYLHFAVALGSSYSVHDSNKSTDCLYKPEQLFCILYLDVWLSLLWYSPFWESTLLSPPLFSLSTPFWVLLCWHSLPIMLSLNLISIHYLCKIRPCLLWLLHESRIEHYTNFVFEVVH